MSKLKNALAFVRQGISIIPLRHRGKEPQADMIGGTWERFQHELATEYQVSRWLAGDWCNYGVVMGWRGLAVIDFDTADALGMWLEYFALLNKHEQIYPLPYMVRTSRGAHVYVSYPVGGANEKRVGVDLKYRGYVVGPGCTHPTGTEYGAMGEFHLIDVFSMDTILPADLFPRVVPVATGPMNDIFFAPDCDSQPCEYDPWVAAGTVDADDLITKVKRAVRIENMFSGVVRTSADGRWLATKCVFHDDNNPSAWIDTQRQLYGCNVCNFKPLDSINLYARTHNVSESDAVSMMAHEFGIWG